MENIWIWLVLFAVLSLVATVVASYFYSKQIIMPDKRRTPVSIFPDQFRLPFENVMFRSTDGLFLRGWYIPAHEESNKTIILMHGHATNRGAILAHTAFLHDLGFNLFYFDFRGCGESQGEISTVGYLELKDFEGALNFLKEHKPDESEMIGLYGISMGAAVAVHETAARDEIRCAVLEASFESYERVVARWAWNHMKVPAFPFVPMALFFARIKLGADPEPFSPRYHVAKISPKPLFFIHGSHDNLSPIKDAKRLFERAGEPKEFWTVPGATHAKCAETAGEEYRKRLGDFFTASLKPPQTEKPAEEPPQKQS